MQTGFSGSGSSNKPEDNSFLDNFWFRVIGVIVLIVVMISTNGRQTNSTTKKENQNKEIHMPKTASPRIGNPATFYRGMGDAKLTVASNAPLNVGDRGPVTSLDGWEVVEERVDRRDALNRLVGANVTHLPANGVLIIIQTHEKIPPAKDGEKETTVPKLVALVHFSGEYKIVEPAGQND